MAELKPCPFCGKDAQIAPDEIGSGGQHVPPYHAGCLRGAGCGIAFTADDPDEAIAEWNRRALAERAGGVKGEWHRADGDKSILLYTLRQDGWRKGEAVMVNDVTVRIEAANGSESPIEPIASAILSTLTTEPAAPDSMTGEDIRRIFQPLPETELTVLREVDPDTWGHPTAAPEGQQEAVEELAAFLCSEFDFDLDPVVGASWPEHKDDDGYRGGKSYVRLQPSDVLARARENASRILAFIGKRAARPSEQAVTEAEDD